MFYGKYIDGVLNLAPSHLHINDTFIYNPTDIQYINEGFKPLIYVDTPIPPEGFQYESSWEEHDDSIVQIWTLAELPPVEPTSDDILNIILGEDVNET